jgi:pimeloyl-ACP methyl ester carboxylesterase
MNHPYSRHPRSESCRRLGAALAVALSLQCAGERVVPAIRYVSINTTTRLEVVDWGGDGTPVVLLAGLGHTAHVFDAFAPRLTDAYHVIGITRRGFGTSSLPDTGYDIATLADDIRVVLDSLGIDRAVLAGHSLGGDEMTLFARRHPERLEALVYIEAAYNRASSRDSMARYAVPSSETPPPSAADIGSVQAYRAYYARVNGVTMPLSEIEAMYRWAPDGRRIGDVTPSWIYGRIIESLEDPNYAGLAMPALAIYATAYPVTELFLDYAARDAATQADMRAYHDASLRIARLSREYFRSHMISGRTEEISGAGHSLYITHAEQVVDAMKRFLADVLWVWQPSESTTLW